MDLVAGLWETSRHFEGGPVDFRARTRLLISDLESGEKPNALREAKRAVELEGDDTYYAPAAKEALAIVEAQTGETASAVARLPKLLKAHYFSWGSFAPLTPALLRLDPV